MRLEVGGDGDGVDDFVRAEGVNVDDIVVEALHRIGTDGPIISMFRVGTNGSVST